MRQELLTFFGAAGLAFAFSGHAPALAKDLGVMGATFPLVEQDLFAVISAKLHRMQESGQMDKINRDLAAHAAEKARRPNPVGGLGRTQDERSWFYDPSIVVDKDIADQKGNVFAHAGQRVNPLGLVNLRQKLIFIDGDNAKDFQWALDQGSEVQTKIILVKGAPIDLMKASDRRIYFDQNGYLTHKFGIENVPAVVKQEGDKLLVREVKGAS
ncbi:TraW [Sphingomonas sp. SKA58]|jgi:conjugal transfer pilus assembly protein TraW|uniref:type-F conjugative transfer system protein TraW n=1 Tax=Sphingomonas sp. (strain SKA58) TaxID=314266 RepID=UPI0000D7BC67|nr:type-F conjugative transfer system protein TraW [Sphingomonas sp. SKA58]EAT07437.1 TraW [Sphingomonas sp. SKA58]